MTWQRDAQTEAAALMASLKGLFKGKGDLLVLAQACMAQRDDLIRQALPSTVAQACVPPLHLLPVHLRQQATPAGTTFLRWRRVDRTAMGVAQWRALMLAPSTPAALIPTLYHLERQRLLLNAQVSLAHTLARLAQNTADKLAYAERTRHQRPRRTTEVL